MSKKYAFSETFYSVQGEGHYTGVPSTWLRFFLCNLQCDGFGQDNPTDPDTYKLPYKDFDVIDVKNIEDLPVWERGCDSSYSWFKKFKHLQQHQTAEEIVETLRSKLRSPFNPGGHYVHPGSRLRSHLVFTGGEPMMKHAQKAVVEIMDVYKSCDDVDRPQDITWETNGTQELTDDFTKYFGSIWTGYEEKYDFNMFISCSPKLFTVSGEETKRAIKPEVVKQYDELIKTRRQQGPAGQLKFVVGPKKEQWDELDETLDKFRAAGIDWPVWIMPVGATVEGQKLVDGDVANMAQERGFNVSARVHTYLWGNVIGV